jgi:hypothetical protein
MENLKVNDKGKHWTNLRSCILKEFEAKSSLGV